MKRSTRCIKTLSRSAACLAVAAGLTGCSIFEPVETSHFIEPKPAPSPYAVASADEEFFSQPFSLVAADSVGLATFGREIAMWDDREGELALADIKSTPRRYKGKY